MTPGLVPSSDEMFIILSFLAQFLDALDAFYNHTSICFVYHRQIKKDPTHCYKIFGQDIQDINRRYNK